MKKKLVLGLTALVVTSAVAIGGTLAFMTAKTDTLTNTFKVNAGSEIKGAIQEPLWSGKDYLGNVVDLKGAQPGEKTAEAMTPGLDIPKNPSLVNTTTDADAFMAIKVTYTGEDGKTPDRSKFNAIASLVENAGWTKDTTYTDANSDIYYFTGTNTDGKLKEVTKNGGTTSTLFDKVTIYGDKNADATPQQVTFDLLKANQFQIKITGAAVQTTNIDDATAKTELVNLLK